MNKLTIRDLNVQGKRVLMRVDFNVPVKDGKVTDDTRITAALPSINYVLENGGSLVLMSHCGRPKGKKNLEFTLKPAADCLAKLVSAKVTLAPDVIGPEVKALVDGLKVGEILVLENLRFYAEEEGKAKLADDATDEEKAAAKKEMKAKQDVFARELATFGDVYVDDAFGTAHRAHASMAVVTKYIDQCAAGFLLEKEIEYLGKTLEAPAKPFVAIIGGAKISGKIDVVINLMSKCDAILIGGGMAYTFYKAKGFPIGGSLVEDDKVELAKEILAQAEAKGVKLMLPLDNIAADKFSAEANVKVVGENIEDGWMALDIGPKTIELYSAEISKAKTVVWNGPMGCFEMAPFAKGTFSICQAVADSDSVSIIGGG
ncbi:MAG: phosphoglycerate kinase, partial [Kiritimatiellales bacterium]|nr:phosphoglycerate kinase [Kiritimatiellales bacterium]